MFKLYKKEEFVVGTYLKYPNNETSLLLLKKDGVYEDVVNKCFVSYYDVFNCSTKNLTDLVNIRASYITKKTAIKYYNSIKKEQETEQINLL